MKAVHLASLGLRFLLELALLGALAYWGFQHDWRWLFRLLAAIGAPLLAASVWGTFVAPRAPYLLEDPWRLLLELLLFSVGAAALAAAHQPVWGVFLFVIFLVDRVALILTAA